jgi:sec-independent protein translocase protein TatA
MQFLAANPSVFALFFGGWEMVLILALLLILFGAKKLPEITRGLGEEVSQFRKHVRALPKEIDQETHDAGESLGGIYGKPAAQALTPDNQTAELYDPAFDNPRAMKRVRFQALVRLWRLIWSFLAKHLNPKI